MISPLLRAGRRRKEDLNANQTLLQSGQGKHVIFNGDNYSEAWHAGRSGVVFNLHVRGSFGSDLRQVC
jgi:hypothetical protein